MRRSVGARVAVMLAMLGLLAAGCSSADDVESSGSSSTTSTSIDATTTEPAGESEPGQPVPTTDPAVEYATYGPDTTTTTSTTTTTVVPGNEPDDLEVASIFDPIVGDLAAGTGVPIRLPIELVDPDSDDADRAEIELGEPTLFSADQDGYVVYLGGPECGGGNACRVATFTAQRVDADSSDDHLDALNGTFFDLPGGIPATFVDATCGANCGDGYVAWIEDDVVFTVGRKVAPGPPMIRWAYSAIDPSVPAPNTPDTCGTNPAVDNGRFANRYEIDGINWLVVCSADGLEVEIVDQLGAVRWIDLGSSDRDIVLERPDGTTRIFFVNGIVPVPLVEPDVGRPVIEDLRCGDVDGDSRIDIVDAATGRNHSSSSDSFVEGAAGLPRCF